MWNVLDFSLLLLLFLLRCTPSAGAPSSTQQRRKEQHKRERQARMEKHRLKARSSGPPSFSAQGELARSSQCPGATVPMPCPNLTSAAAPVFVLHVPKAGGRTLTHVGSELTRPILKPCSFSWGNENRGFPSFRKRQRIRYGGTQGVFRDWGDEEGFTSLVQGHRADVGAKPCFASYEGSWRVVSAGFG